MALLLGAAVLTACSDDDYSYGKTPLLKDGSVVTGSSDVTASSATMYGTVEGLEKMSSASYATGFYYGYSEDALTEVVTANSAGEFQATLDGLLENQVIYYQAYVTLQGKLTYTGEVKSLITTDATVTTGGASDITFADATLYGTASKYPSSAKVGIVIAAEEDQEVVRAGLQVEGELADAFSAIKKGLMPNTTYYYAAYLDLGPGVVYGDVKSFTTEEKTYKVDDDFVDLGLSVKWAKCNIGASSETDFGGLFGFGDITGVKSSIDPADYASEDTYMTLKDVAYHATGGIGTLPTADLFEELFTLCTTEWTEQDGVPGYKVTGKNGNSIFLPAAGKRVESTISEEGVQGYYLTGSINPSNTEFAVDYEFNAGTGTRATRAVYEALAVRPVTVARDVAFDKTLLYQKWYLDNGQDEKQHVFVGPFTQWGAHDTWGTVTNNEANPYEQIHWDMGPNDGWVGYTYGKDYGYMEFFEDGTMQVVRYTFDDQGKKTSEDVTDGTYTIDETNKTITTSIDVLAADTWLPTKKGTLNILTLTEDQVQIALPAGDGTYAYSLNFYSEAKKKKDDAIPVNFVIVNSSWTGDWNYIADNIAPAELNGQHTAVLNGSTNDVMVGLIDFKGLHERYPNAIVTVNDIKLDGVSIPFDGNRFFYGDIENNGTFRVELFNIFGKGAANELVALSAFSNKQNVRSEDAIHYSNSIEVTYTIDTEGLSKHFTPCLITIDKDWGGPWDYNQGAYFNITLEDGVYGLSQSTFDITYSGSEPDGTMMTFIEIADLFGLFPQTHATLNSLKLDNSSVQFDASKVVDTNDKTKYRLELWNQWGATQNDCAFGTPYIDGPDKNKIIAELGFSSSMQLNFTINSLFTRPSF